MLQRLPKRAACAWWTVKPKKPKVKAPRLIETGGFELTKELGFRPPETGVGDAGGFKLHL